MIVEFHHANNECFVCEEVEGKIVQGEELRSYEVPDTESLYSAWKSGGRVVVRNKTFDVIGFSGFFLGYDVSRFYLSLLSEASNAK